MKNKEDDLFEEKEGPFYELYDECEKANLILELFIHRLPRRKDKGDVLLGIRVSKGNKKANLIELVQDTVDLTLHDLADYARHELIKNKHLPD